MMQSEGMRPGWAVVLLAVLAVVGAGVTVWRSEPLTRGLNAMLAMSLLVLIIIALRAPNWLHFGMLDYLIESILLFGASLTRAARLPLLPRGQETEGQQSSWRRTLGAVFPVLRGLLLALPIVLIFASLLAAADPIFGDNIDALLKIFDLKRLPEYIVRLIIILCVAYLFAGSLLHALLPEETRSKHPVVLGWMRFLGWTEAVIVLVSVNLLFAFFVAIQFRYFFGGEANITAAGYTYSEYARRGFFELVWVAILSLTMISVLGALTRREQPGQLRTFVALSGVLVALVWVMLVSGFMRLQLYEEAYGFTRLRTYTHLFIPWLGLVLLVTVVLLAVRREKYFIAVILAACAGFSLTLGLANVDALIARQNIQRADRGAGLVVQQDNRANELDSSYLVTLSDDALPVLVARFSSPETTPAVRDELGAVLACRVYRMRDESQQPWQSYHPGAASARMELVGLDLSGYPVKMDFGGYSAAVQYGDGKIMGCYSSYYD